MSWNPARILNLDKGILALGSDADITVINPDLPWTVDVKSFHSRGKNSPFHGRSLKGRAVMTIVGGDIKYNGLAEKP
jgi:dihydroorotase